MNTSANPILQKTEKVVRQLVEECQKHGPLYQANPRAVAQVSRTGKWLLNAIAQLNKQPDHPKENKK